MTETDRRFIAYEYTSVQAKADQESLFKDIYRSLGWTCEAVERPSAITGTVTLRLKRDRAVPNRTALAKLQRQAENTLEGIENLRRSKTSKASITSLSVGVLGAAAFAGSVFCYLSGIWVPFVLLGIAGLVAWVLPYFVFIQIKATRTATVNEEIERHYDQLYATCEQAAALTGRGAEESNQ
ncbi:MAG: hypothetical protein LBJ08_02895 [Bifidobacteriaceae bacterium]|jgi:Flp pilus assembly protein TadB|nr:hypothetical protein [Bifidobacteriaceae bacterium]